MSSIANAKIQQLVQTQPVVAPKTTPAPAAPSGAPNVDFSSLLADRLKVSGHAQTRLASRDIQLDAEQWQRVLDGVDRAANKGARESLVLIDDVALLVSVKNRTVITAVDQANLKENVFTNIDSAVIV